MVRFITWSIVVTTACSVSDAFITRTPVSHCRKVTHHNYAYTTIASQKDYLNNLEHKRKNKRRWDATRSQSSMSVSRRHHNVSRDSYVGDHAPANTDRDKLENDAMFPYPHHLADDIKNENKPIPLERRLPSGRNVPNKLFIPISDLEDLRDALTNLTHVYRNNSDFDSSRKSRYEYLQSQLDTVISIMKDMGPMPLEMGPIKDRLMAAMMQNRRTGFRPFGSGRSDDSLSQQSSDTGQFFIEKVSSDFNFSSIGGYSEIKEELYQVLDFIKNRDEYSQYGVRMIKGILLHGETGTGKTLLAKCLAGESKMNFICCSASEFIEKYVGVGAARIRELFKFAKQNIPCIVFIDEIDAFGTRDSGEGEVSHPERDQTLNQLLSMMDGFHVNENILIIAATNRIEKIDSAVLRPGRFDKKIHVPNPDAETRRDIISIHKGNKPLNVTTEDMVSLTTGFNGAQIEFLLNEAVLRAIRKKTLPVSKSDMELVREIMIMGQVTNFKQNVTDSVLQRVAVHEVGHLLMAMRSTFADRPAKVTIDSVNPKSSLGYTIFDIDEETANGFFLREYLEDKIKILLGGRIAEEMVFGQSVSTGALQDLEHALHVAKTMIVNYGMGRHIIYPYMSEAFKQRIDEQIHSLIHRLHQETKQTLLRERVLFNKLVEELVYKKTLHWTDIQAICLAFV